MALIIKEVAVKETRTRTVDRRFSATEPAKECDVADCADNQRERSLNHQDEGSGSNPEPEEGSGGKKWREIGVRLGSRDNWQIKPEAAFFRDADIIADKPGCLCRDAENLPRTQAGGWRDLHRQNHFPVIAKTHQRAEGDGLRGWPGDGADLAALRQGQGDFRGRPGIPCMAPIAMPARREAKAQPKLKRLPLRDGQMIRNQCHPRTRRFLRSAFQRPRR